jgi:hypothetical protein
MYGTFYNADAFNQAIGSWDSSSVTDMRYMFFSADAFDQDIGSWNATALTDATFMFNGIQLSTVNYDALLIGWGAQALQNGVPFSGGNSFYCAGEVARNNMMSAYSWTITDNGLYCNATWDGGGVDNNWSTALNWVGDTVPLATDTVRFNSTSSKDAIIDPGFSGVVTGMIITDQYNGTISFGRSLAVSEDYSQDGGTVIVDPAHAFMVEDDFAHTGGILQETKPVGSNSVVNFLQIQTSGGIDVYRGVDLDTQTIGGQDLGSTTVSIRAVDLVTEYCTTNGVASPVYAGRCYDISPTNNHAANVKLWALSSELPVGLTNPSVYHYEDGAWVEQSNIATGTVGDYTWASGNVAGFSPFLMAQAGNAPTAVTLQAISAQSPISVMAVVLGPVLAVLTGFVVRRQDC